MNKYNNINNNKKNKSTKKGKNKTIYVYFIKQKLFGYCPSSVLIALSMRI